MARRVFFCFHPEKDGWRAKTVTDLLSGKENLSFLSQAEFDEARSRGGDSAIKPVIRQKLVGTNVTVVLIGAETASLPLVRFVMEQSCEARNGLLGIHIDNIKDKNGNTCPRGGKPMVPGAGMLFPIYVWDGDVGRLQREIEAAGARSDRLRG